MAEAFRVDAVNHDAGTVIFRVHGCLDASSAPDFMRKCQTARSAGRNVILNLSAVSFIASSGVGALLALADGVEENSGTVQLVALSDAVDSVIRLLNLDQFLTILGSEQDALGGHKAA